MGEKNTETTSYTLYLNDETVMKLNKCEICEDSICTDEIPKIMKFSESVEGTIELKNVRINRNALLSALFGRKVTNNWLKKHGGVMTRKKGKR